MCKISIVVPAYNAENEITRCIESILNQTFVDFELIIIDDGSTDQTKVVCERYASNDERICFVHQSNRGVAATRNMGMDMANGEWITFVDADDYLDSKCLEESYILANEYNTDIVLWNLQNEYGAERIVLEKPLNGDIRIFEETSVNYIEKMMLTRLSEDGKKNQIGNLIGPVCKLIRKECVQGIRFPEELDFGEDTCFCFQLIKKCNKLVYTSKCYYHRVVTNGSLTQNIRADMWKRRLKRLNWIVDYYKDDVEKMEDEFNCFFYQDYRSLLINYFVSKNTLNYKECKAMVMEYKTNQKYSIDYKKIKDWYKFVIKYDMFFLIRFAGIIKNILKGKS